MVYIQWSHIMIILCKKSKFVSLICNQGLNTPSPIKRYQNILTSLHDSLQKQNWIPPYSTRASQVSWWSFGIDQRVSLNTKTFQCHQGIHKIIILMNLQTIYNFVKFLLKWISNIHCIKEMMYGAQLGLSFDLDH